MHRDTKEFKERFLRWKNGEKVYDGGRPISIDNYSEGKDPYEDYRDFLTQYEGFRDTTYLDGKGIPTIGYGFTDSALVKKGKISKAEADAYLDARIKKEETALRDTLQNWDKLSVGAKTALISYRFNYPAGFKDTTNFMKYWNAGDYAKAIKEVDAGWNDTANPGLRKRRMAEQALLSADPFLSGTVAAPVQEIRYDNNISTAPRISTYVNNKFKVPTEVSNKESNFYPNILSYMNTLRDLLLLKSNWDWPNMQKPKLPPLYPLNGNEFTNALIGYEGGKDLLPGFIGGEDGGFINWMKNALIGASVADAPAVATASGWKQDDNGNWVQERTPESTQLANNLSVLSTFSPTHPANAILNGAFSLARKGVKAANSVFRNAFKLNKPVIQPLGAAPIDYSLPGGNDKIIEELYREAILGESIGSPYAVATPQMKQVPSWATESIQNSTIPRMVLMKKELPPEQLAEWIKNSVGNEYGEFSNTAYKLAGKENFAGFYNPKNDFVSIKRGNADWALLHELRHKIDLHIPLSPEEVQILKEAFTDDFLSLSSTVDRFKDLDLSKEMVTTNGDIRRLLLGDQVDWSASIDKQNELIDAARDIDIIDALQHANGYGREYYNLLIDKYGEVPKKIISALRNSMKKIGVGTGVAAGANKLNEGYKHGKDSGIHIKPENRGKFTALKKRTGKSASWFKVHGTPALKKMATFALNARKWKH